ncbi:hypothetical protein [Candidatus Hecatella orcuttiae]|uniref:hypothetical protein n=1 Tax=Candidatus Hecatella orcuttiae TaxID=1935119 RepID=UPI00286821B0|nr:hypothetical protein [Candidatus Hecatella orcuttiae]
MDKVKTKALLSILLGFSFAVISLAFWYFQLSPLIPPEFYRPLHHWMYGLFLVFVGFIRLEKNYGQFFFTAGLVYLIDDAQDLPAFFI